MSGRALGKARHAGDRGGLEASGDRMRSKGLCWQMRGKALCWQNAEQSLAFCLGRTRPAVLSHEERRSEAKFIPQEFQGCRLHAFVRGDQQEAPAVSLSW